MADTGLEAAEKNALGWSRPESGFTACGLRVLWGAKDWNR